MPIDKNQVEGEAAKEAASSKPSFFKRVGAASINPALHGFMICILAIFAFMWGVGLHFIIEMFNFGWDLIHW